MLTEARDFPLDSLESCGICDLNHSTDHCPSLPKMKETYHRDLGVATNLLQQSCQPWPTSMVQNSIPPFPYFHTQPWNTLPPWQLLQRQFNSYLPYPQGWNSLFYSVPPSIRDGGAWERGNAHWGRVEAPPNFGVF